MKNSSSEIVYFLISSNRILDDPNEIARIRPNSYESIMKRDSLDAPGSVLYQYRIEKNGTAVILTSESAEFFVDVVTIQSIILDRYNGEANIFIIKSDILEHNSDEDIIGKKMYSHIISITKASLTGDTTVFEYK